MNAESYSSIFDGVKKTILNNGLTVILKEDHSHPVVSVQVWVKAGSVNETEKTSGLTHFLEHLIFKGTEKYPGMEISGRVEKNGGVINAATSKEYTFFHIETSKEGLKEAVEILADMMSNAVFPEDEINKERPVVISEIKRHEDNPHAILYDKFSDLMFSRTPYRRRVLGDEKVVENVAREEIMSYYKAHYVPSNMYVSIAGDFKAGETLSLVKKTFGAQKGAAIKYDLNLEEKAVKPRSIRIKKDVEQGYLLAGFLGPVINSEEQFTADVAGTILGSGRASRLHKRIREEKQLAYHIGASFWTQRGTGVMVISSVFDPEKESELIEEIASVIKVLEEDGPSQEELNRAKQMIKSEWYFGNEVFHDKASLFAYWYLQGYPEMIGRYIKGIERVTVEDVKKFLAKYYGPYGLSLSVVVPEK
jgi:zinc protease